MLCTIVVLVCGHVSAEAALRVIGGRDALPGELPYVVRVEAKLVQGSHIQMIHLCTGTVITPNWVLTAAHCILDEVELVIRYGSVDNPPGAPDTFRPVVELIKHPRFHPDLQRLVKSDIGLLRIQYLKLQQYGRLSSVPHMSLIGLEAVSAGYGLMNTSSGFQSTLDLKKPLQILQVLMTKCGVGHKTAIPSICLTPLCGKKNFLYKGDSGGPTLHSSGVVGVCSTSWNDVSLPERDRSYHTSKLNPVSPHLNWILSHVRP